MRIIVLPPGPTLVSDPVCLLLDINDFAGEAIGCKVPPYFVSYMPGQVQYWSPISGLVEHAFRQDRNRRSRHIMIHLYGSLDLIDRRNRAFIDIQELQ